MEALVAVPRTRSEQGGSGLENQTWLYRHLYCWRALHRCRGKQTQLVLGWQGRWQKYPGVLRLHWLLKTHFRWKRWGMYCQLAVLLGLPLSDEPRVGCRQQCPLILPGLGGGPSDAPKAGGYGEAHPEALEGS